MSRKEPTGVLMPRHKKALWAAVRALESELGSCSDRTDPFQRERRKELQMLLKNAKDAMVEVRELVERERLSRKLSRGDICQ